MAIYSGVVKYVEPQDKTSIATGPKYRPSGPCKTTHTIYLGCPGRDDKVYVVTPQRAGRSEPGGRDFLAVASWQTSAKGSK